MEASHVLGSKSRHFSTTLPHQKHSPKLKQSHIVAVLTQPADNLGIVREGSILRPAETVKGVRKKSSGYDDNWFDQLAIHHLSQSVQAATGLRNCKSGYESLVEAASSVSRNFDLRTQRELVINALERAFPSQILFLIRTLLPQSKFTREYFAVFTTFFFAWLVGPCEVKESEFNGRRERNVVHINKCRFLEQSNCVGMCNNLCKIPSQTFIKKSLGVPVNMVPNFEDMSCEMIFGQDPPINDPALNQPCSKLCKAKQRHNTNCSS